MRFRKKIVTIEEMKHYLDIVKKMCIHVYNYEKPIGVDFKQDAYITCGKAELRVSFSYGLRPCTYICRLDGEIPKSSLTTGAECYALFRRYFKEDILPLEEQNYFGAKTVEEVNEKAHPRGFVAYNDQYRGKEVIAYSYDMHSAYSNFLKKDWPDVSKGDLGPGLVMGNMIGFNLSSTLGVETVINPGNFPSQPIAAANGFNIYAEHRFYTMPCPEGVVKFIDHIEAKELYAKKQIKRYTALIDKYKDNPNKVAIYKKHLYKHTLDKSKIKNTRNYVVGMLKHKMPWVRASVVGRCNLFFKRLFRMCRGIYSNTDSIVLLQPNKALDDQLGEGVGQFAREHEAVKFRMTSKKRAYTNEFSYGYQWEGEIPVVSGTPKCYYKHWEKVNGRKYNLLTDEAPEAWLPYVFHFDTLTIEEVNE